MTYYKLAADGRTPIPVDDVIEWSKFFGDTEARVVKQEDFPDEVRVSTVFLGIDHGFGFRRGATYQPVLWETMIFNGPHDGWQDRATSYDDAIQCHKHAVHLVLSTPSHIHKP